jgi:hypothetical protein
MFVIVESSTIMSCATAITPSTHQRRASGASASVDALAPVFSGREGALPDGGDQVGVSLSGLPTDSMGSL